ncbi:hypothetical protein [Actinomadura welshii]|uniref:hypothetical protein n=1 Tax=Actinomadura welshii TaxID=3103817 RepID=UPI000415C3F1|nr:hypothetical protein [Actinomadura madurae]
MLETVDLSEIGDIFQRVMPGGWVITGPPGSGKTTTAIVLVLALLERRRPDGPVPVMVSMAAWDPARQPFEDWLAELIAEKYGLPSEVARDLVGRRRIIPILDGFDELPVEKAGWALRRINSAVRVDDPLVIVARDGSLGRAVGSRQGEPLRRALVLRLMPVPFPRVVHCLESLLPQADYPGWNRWREELGRDGALAQALSLPANIRLVRSAYLDDRRPLPDFGSLNASGVAERLLSDWIDRLYPRNGRERSWLGEIARRSGDGVPGDFSWWLLRRRLPRWALALPVGVLDLLVGGVLLAGCFGTSTPNVIAASIWGLTWLAALLVAGGFAQFAVRMPVWKTTEPVVQFRRSLVFRMAFAALVGVTGGLAIGSGVTDARVENGVFLGAGVAFNILSASSVGLYALSVVIFAVRGRLPWRPLSFLEEARQQGVVRVVGGAYQFRYRQIPDLLAASGPDSHREFGDAETGQASGAGPGPVARGERLDAFAREAVLVEVLGLPEVLRRVDQREPARSRARLQALAAELIDDDPLAVETPARERGERFDEALLAFEKAADLPFLSRFVTGYLVIAAGAGALLAGLFVARGRWGGASDAIFVAWVVLLISVLLWASFRRAAGQRRAVRSRDPAKWLQLDALSHLRPALERTYRDWVRAMARDGLLPLLNERLGEEPPAYTTELHGLELEPLSGTDERDDHFVPTDASRRVSLLIEELSSASIGLSGVRGAGKSTVLRQLCDPERHPDNDLRLLVHAPTAYDSREFLTHLFIRVCERVVGDRGPRPAPARRIRMLAMHVLPWAAVGAGLALIVGTLYRAKIADVVGLLPDQARVYLLAGGGLLIAAGLSTLLLFNRRPHLRSMTRAQVAAHAHLRRLRYQQAVTRTATGEMAVPGGGKVGGQLAVQQTEQAQSLPGLVADFQELLRMVGTERRADRNKVVIGVDELDKIATAGAAEQFLNDLKVIFGVPGCYFLVTVSEDALAAFGRRSLSVRDTFDSAFDTVVEVPPLRGEEAMALLNRRGVPLPVPYVWLCHVMTAGLARDLIRSVRALAALAAEGESRLELEHLAREMIAEDVAAVMGAQLRAAAAAEEEGTAALLEWLAACADTPVTGDDLEAGIATMPERGLSLTARTFAVQARTYLAIAATLVRLFVENPKDSAEWLRGLGERREERHPLDRLAEIRGLLANHPQLAWHAVLRLRREATWPVPLPTLDPQEG